MKTIKNPTWVILGLLTSIFLTSAALPIFILETSSTSEHHLNFKNLMMASISMRVLMELPSGFLADKFGRWLVLLAGNILNILAALFFFFSDGLSLLICQTILLLSSSAFSGTVSAYLYEILERSFGLKNYLTLEAICQGLLYSSWLILINFSPLDQHFSFPTVVNIFLVPNILSIFILLMLPRFIQFHPAKFTSSQAKQSFWSHSLETFIKAINHAELKLVIFGTSIALGANKVIKNLFFMPDPFQSTAFDGEETLAIASLAGLIFSVLYFRKKTIIRIYQSTILLSLLNITALLLSLIPISQDAFISLSITANCVAYFAYAAIIPATLWVVNQHFSSMHRAMGISMTFMIQYWTFIFLFQLYQSINSSHLSTNNSIMVMIVLFGLFVRQFILSNRPLLQDYQDSNAQN